MEGYDLTLVAGFFAQPQFRRFYGTQAANGEWIISAAWQAGLQNGVQVGSIFGLTFGGYINVSLTGAVITG
jgi:SP family general alpha glucoside:H+ symporter-like MFS transporter